MVRTCNAPVVFSVDPLHGARPVEMVILGATAVQAGATEVVACHCQRESTAGAGRRALAVVGTVFVF